MSLFDFVMFPIAVAAASASETDLAFMQTASAFPKLNEWPTVPDDVQIPIGISFFLTIIDSLSLSGELPADMPT